MAKFHIPSVEQLEDRLTPSGSIWGVPWPNPGQLTLSFVRDGTQAGLGTSNLSQTLNAIAPTATWEQTILRAFQTWAVNAGINISVVPDDGAPLGTPGAVQGDPRFGDIRIAATAPGTSGTTDVANSSPFSWTGTTWSGDVVLNSSFPFTMGNVSGKYDLFSVALHEAGHVFGLDNNSNASSAMYSSYEYHTQLSSGDVAALQALYGPRPGETTGNNTIASATPLSLTYYGATTTGDVSTLQDADYYRIQTPAFLSALLTGYSGFTAQVQTSDISLLMSSLQVYNASGKLVGSASAADPTDGDISVSIDAKPSSTYYIRVAPGTSSVFGIGSYQLNVTNEYGGVLAVVGALVNGLGTIVDDTFATATHLLSRNPGNSLVPDYFVQGDLTNQNPVNYYVVQSPASSTGTVNMVAMMWAQQANSLEGRIHVYDAQQNSVAAQVLANDGNTYTIQIPNAQAGASYYVEVAPANSSSLTSGNYSLVADFHQQQVLSFDNITAGTLSQAQAQASGTLTLSREGLYYFALSSFSSNPNAWVTMTITDANGNLIAAINAQANQPTATADVYLLAGTYTVSFSAWTSDGSALGGISYNLNGDYLTSPVGAYQAPPSSSGSSTYAPPSTYSPSAPPPSGGSTAHAPPPSSAPTYY